jgi:4-carboxymuconolactone decarboxylase
MSISVAYSSHAERVDATQLTMSRSTKLLVFGALAVSVWGASIAEAPTPSAAHDASIEMTSAENRTSNPGAPANFTGHAQVEQLFLTRGASRLTGGVVIFQPCARSAWHTHPLGQILIITAGTGLIQQWGGPVRIMKIGTVVWIPAGVKHWHGASPSTSLTQMAIQEVVDGKNVDWLEPVTDQQYSAGIPKVSQ